MALRSGSAVSLTYFSTCFRLMPSSRTMSAAVLPASYSARTWAKLFARSSRRRSGARRLRQPPPYPGAPAGRGAPAPARSSRAGSGRGGSGRPPAGHPARRPGHFRHKSHAAHPAAAARSDRRGGAGRGRRAAAALGRPGRGAAPADWLERRPQLGRKVFARRAGAPCRPT